MRSGSGARRTPGTSAVVAQVGGGGGRSEAAGRAGAEESAAGRQADVGETGVLARVEPSGEVVAAPERRRGACPARAERQAVGDGGPGRERRRSMRAPRRIEYEGLVRVGDEERGVVSVVVGSVGDPALAVRLAPDPP